MSFNRPLRGSCHCGRNRYIITLPQQTTQQPRVLFNHHSLHSISHMGSPLSAYLRVPLQWYFSTTLPFFPDETTSMISRVYPTTHEQRRFCGFCGTLLSYWSEDPRTEADYIQLALGSLLPEDLADLEDLGFVPGSDEDDNEAATEQDAPMSGHEESAQALAVQEPHQQLSGPFWFETLTEGSRLGTLRRAKGSSENRGGTVKVEWEVVEWTADDEAGSDAPRNGKRKLADRESGSGASAMEGVQQ
ncbi:hypothetical protein QBC47DRAFT_93276 [Echria macrotheca]|uniref:CENP-V/GFA domain-containing protein n=1 Tax=Echria macrotheca TaxID=438768 RepID=A0AAJ0F715_9PEZI|nr:hypothetical protein QBC47DRAFT_93276 [Echria macrotheca]